MYVPNKSILQNGTLIELTLSLFVIRIGLHRSRCVILLILLQINQLPALLFIILLHTNPWQFSALETCLSKNSNRTQIVILSSLLTFHTSFLLPYMEQGKWKFLTHFHTFSYTLCSSNFLKTGAVICIWASRSLLCKLCNS